MIDVRPGARDDIAGLLDEEGFRRADWPRWQLLDDAAFERKIARGEWFMWPGAPGEVVFYKRL